MLASELSPVMHSVNNWGGGSVDNGDSNGIVGGYHHFYLLSWSNFYPAIGMKSKHLLVDNQQKQSAQEIHDESFSSLQTIKYCNDC